MPMSAFEVEQPHHKQTPAANQTKKRARQLIDKQASTRKFHEGSTVKTPVIVVVVAVAAVCEISVTVQQSYMY